MSDVIHSGVIEVGMDATGVDAGIAKIDSSFTKLGKSGAAASKEVSAGIAKIGDGSEAAAVKVETSTGKVTRSIANLGKIAAASGKEASDGIAKIGDGGDASARKIDAATKNMAGSIQRTTAVLEAGSKSTAKYFETLANQRGIDVSALKPYLDQLRAVESAQARATAEANLASEAQVRLAESTRAEAQARREAARVQSGQDAFIVGLREQIQLYGRSTDEVLRYRAAQAGVAESASPLILQLQNIRTAHEQIAVAARAEAQEQQKAVQIQSGRDSFISGLEQQANAIGKTRTQLLELQAAQLGVSSQASPFIARLREAETAVSRTGVSAGQTAQALRQLPAQFSDIAVSLQGGQKPLSVFLQQGAQIKDSFGGAGPAVKAMAGYVVGLISPLTIAAVAAGGLAYAFHEGGKEAEAYNRALILSGNAAGTSSGQLGDMARNISKSVGTQGEAAEALGALASTGKVSAANLEQFGVTAVKVQRALGQSVGDTAAQFADLAKAPVASLLKLDEQYHFLTSSVYKQVKALEDQGRVTEAGTVAQKAFSAAADDVATKLVANLGSVERGWISVKDVAKDAWDAMLGVGREQSLTQQLAAVQEKIKKAQDPNASSLRKMDALAELPQNLLIEASLQKQLKIKKESNEADAVKDKLRLAGLAWDRVEEQYLPRALQLKREIKAVETAGRAAKIDESKIDITVGEVRKKYADIYNDGIDSQIEAIKRRGTIEEITSKRSLDLLTSNHAAGSINDKDYIEKTESLNLAAFAKEKGRLQEELKLTAEKQNSLKAQAALRGQINAIDETVISRRKQTQNELNELEVKAARLAANNYADVADRARGERDALVQQVQAQIDYNDRIGLSKNAIAQLDAARSESIALLLDEKAVTADLIDISGVLGDGYREQAKALRELTSLKIVGAAKDTVFEDQKKLWESIDQTAHDTFTNIFTDGKNAFDKLRDTLKSGLLDLLYQMTVKKWIFQIGASVTGFSGLSSTAQAAGISGSGLASDATGAASLLQVGKGAYTAITNGFAGIQSTVTQYAQQAINQFGVNTGSYAGMTSGVVSPLASGIGTAAGYAGGLAAGKFLGSTISGSYSLGDHGSAVVNIAAITGSIFGGPIGGAIGGAIGGLINRAFGMGETEVTGRSLTGLFGTAGFAGDNNVMTHQDGGWFRSDRNDTQTTAIDAAMAKTFTDGYDALKTASSGFAKTLGIDAAAIAARAQDVNIALTADAAANQQAITDFFVGVGDQIARELLPTLGDFSKASESASATLQRLAGDYQAVDAVLATVGRTSELAFNAVGVASLAAREQLIDAAGGIDALTNGTVYFAQNFLTQAEQMAPIIKNVSDQLGVLGLSGTTTEAQFKAAVLGIVDSGALATKAGADQYAALLQLAPQFKQVTDYTDQLTGALDGLGNVIKTAAEIAGERKSLQDQLDQLTLSSVQLLEKQRDALDGSNKALFDQVQAATSASAAASALAEANKVAADALASTNAGYQQQIDAILKAVMSVADQRALEVKGMDETTRALYDRLNALNDEAAAQVASTKAQADALESLKSAAGSAMAILSASIGKQKDISKSAFDAQITIINAQKSAAQTVFEGGKVTIQASISAATAASGKIASLGASLQSTLDGMRIDSQQATYRKAAQDQIASALSVAKLTGVLPDADALKVALQTVSQPSEALFTTFQDYAFDFARTKNDIQDLVDITGTQLSASDAAAAAAGAQLDALQKQYDVETAGFDAAADSAKATYDANVQYYDDALKVAQQQLDAALGTNIAVMSVSDALSNLGAVMGALAVVNHTTGAVAAVAPQTSGTVVISPPDAGVGVTAPLDAVSDEISKLYLGILGRAPDAGGLDFWKMQVTNGATEAQIAAAFYSSDEWKSVHGSHAGGLDRVPFNNYRANLHADEAVLTAPQASAWRNSGRGTGADDMTQALLTEVRGLRAENLAMRQILDDGLYAIAKYTSNSADTLDAWDKVGIPEERAPA